MTNYYSPFKICFHQDKIQALKEDPSSIIPAQVMLSITNKCNFDCKYCHNKIFFTRNDEELSYKVITEIIDDCVDMGVEVIQLTGGGEPSIHSDFKKIVNYIGEKGLRIGLVTNGTGLHQLGSEFQYFDWIRISIDANDEKSFNSYHKNSDIELYQKNMDIVEKIKKVNKNVVVGFSYIITKENFIGTSRAVDMARYYKFDNIRLTPVHTKNINHFDDYEIEDIIENIQLYKDLYENNNFKIFAQTDRFNYLETDGKKSFKECHYQDFVAFVGADGKLPPCCELQKQHSISDKTVNEERFKTLWKNRKRITVEECKRVCFFSKQNELINYLMQDKPEHVDFV